MENYVFLKKRIFKNQRESEYTVLNYDDSVVRDFLPEIRSKVKWVSINERVDGAYMQGGKLYYCDEYVMDERELKLKGEHNVYNTLFAIVCAKLAGVQNEAIVASLKSFKGVRHRIEHVCTKNGVEFYNDSKATNTASTISALQSMQRPTVLILGGSEKGESYINLFEKIKRSTVKHVILTGASRFNMLDAAGKTGYSFVTVTSNFTDAVKIAAMLVESGDNLLLSPACASFDSFDGYEERGDAFVKIVEGL
jgi:UDP-N-acetylmuramoylalanine--D-glutamate ligase